MPEVNRTAAQLRTILQRYKNKMHGASFSYKKLAGIGTNKFIAAHFDFASGRRDFYEAYGKTIRDFLAIFQQSHVLYGYSVIPHVSVASTAKPQAVNVTINTTNCGRINNVNLMHSGRDLFVQGSFFDATVNNGRGAIRRLRSYRV